MSIREEAVHTVSHTVWKTRALSAICSRACRGEIYLLAITVALFCRSFWPSITETHQHRASSPLLVRSPTHTAAWNTDFWRFMNVWIPHENLSLSFRSHRLEAAPGTDWAPRRRGSKWGWQTRSAQVTACFIFQFKSKEVGGQGCTLITYTRYSYISTSQHHNISEKCPWKQNYKNYKNQMKNNSTETLPLKPIYKHETQP